MTVWRSLGRACATVAIVAGTVGEATAAPPRHLANDEAVEVAYLVAAGTADSLATASLLAHLVETKRDTDKKPDSTALIRRAVSLAPERPELLWLQLRDCELSHCEDEKKLVEQLRAVDPDNGIVLLPSLSDSMRGPPEETTRVIAQLGAAPHLTLYWNKLVTGMFDALTHGAKARPATALSYEADDRLTHVVGVLTAIAVPPFKPILLLCASEQFAEAGRRAACESLMTRLDASDSIIAQSLSTRVQQKWSQAGSAEARELRERSLQQRYLVEESGRARGAQVNEDATARVNAMRRLATEEEVDKAMLTAFGEPLQRPAEWQGAVAH